MLSSVFGERALAMHDVNICWRCMAKQEWAFSIDRVGVPGGSFCFRLAA